MPGRVVWSLPAFLLFMSFYSGDPVAAKKAEMERLFQKANHFFNNPRPTDSTDKLALACFEQIIQASEKNPGGCPDSILFQSYTNKGILLDVQFNYAGAKEAYLQALCVQKKSKELSDSIDFRVYVYAGTCYYNLNNFDSANILLLRAESLMNLYPGVSEKERLYSILGVLYYDNGNYLQSKNYFTQALEIIQSRHPYDNAAAVSFQTNIAASYYRLGLYDECLSIYHTIIHQHALSAYQGIPNYIYNNMGRANAALNKYAEAMACFRKVNSAELPGVFNEMAHTSLLLHRDKEAAHFLDLLTNQALKKGNRINELDLGINALYRAELLNGSQQYLPALENLQKAIIIFSGNFGNKDLLTNPVRFTGSFAYYRLFDALFSKAQTLQRLFERRGGEQYLKASLDTYQSALSLLSYIEKNYDTDDAKIFLKKKNQQAYQDAISLCLQLYRLHPAANYLEQAFGMMEKNKASIMAAGLQQNNSGTIPGIDQGMLQKERNIKYNIARLNVQSDQEQDRKTIEAIAREKMQYEIELSRLQKGFEQNSRYYKLKYSDDYPGVQALQQHIGKEQALISFYFTSDGLHVFGLTSTSLVYKRIDSVPVLQNDIRDWIRLLTSTQSGRKFRAGETGLRIYRQLIRPLQSLVPGKKEWIIIPDGLLYFLPFESLPADEGSKTVLETVTVSYLFSPRFLINPAAAEPQDQSGSSVLAFAPFAKQGIDKAGTYMNTLPASADEISGLPGKAYLDSQATKEQFLKDINKYPILHLATHAVADINNVSASFIAFYPQKKSRLEDCLYLEELYGLKLGGTKLVIISACETGKGELVNSEGVISLARAFTYAGCASTVNSLWKADDEATSGILKQFHHYLQKGYTKSKALQQAKLDYIQSNALHTSPDYWSNLILIGNTDPVCQKPQTKEWFLLTTMILGVFTFAGVRERKRIKKKSTLSKDNGL
jgi:CHAT domain-containing protein